MTQAKKKRAGRRSRKAAFHGKQYAIVDCPFCGASIYQRHLNSHINKFHPGTVISSEPQKHIAQPSKINSNEQLEVINDKISDITEDVIIDANEMLLAITRLGMPCTLQVLENRLHNFFLEQLKSKKQNLVKIHIAW
jgi:hypothetical protein